jgi:hypothetical protein
VRWLLSLRALSIVTYAGGNSCLSPAERPHAVFGRAVAGFPIGHVDEPAKALDEVCYRFSFLFFFFLFTFFLFFVVVCQRRSVAFVFACFRFFFFSFSFFLLAQCKRRVELRTFSGSKLVAETLPPGEWSLWLPPCFAEFINPRTSAARVRELSDTVVQLPVALLSLLSSFHLPTPHHLTFGALETASTAPHSCINVSKYCVDFFSCNNAHCGCGGQPRGGMLSSSDRALLCFPLSLPLLAGQSPEHLHYVDYERCVRLARRTEHTQLQQRVLVDEQPVMSARDALYVADFCCPTGVAKTVVRERRLLLPTSVCSFSGGFFFCCCAARSSVPPHSFFHFNLRARLSLAQTSAVELAAVPHEQLRLLAQQCCVGVKELREALLHQATVTINRANAGRRRRVNPQQLTTDMSAADIHQQCTAEFLRAWLQQRDGSVRTSGLNKAQLVEAAARCLRNTAM